MRKNAKAIKIVCLLCFLLATNLGLTCRYRHINITQSDTDYWNDSYVLVWINQNIVATRRITSFDPANNSIFFKDLGENAI